VPIVNDNDLDYLKRIARLEDRARFHPKLFRATVVLMSLAAYGLVFALLAGGVAATGWLFQWAHASGRPLPMLGFTGWVLTLIPLVFLTLRMFLMRLDPPEGRPLTAAEAPRLFQVLGELRRRLKGPPIHQVLITRDFNAAITQTPRFGLFGGHRNTLVLGLPFLYGMAPKEFIAVIAHEYGHLAGSHGKLSAWIYRQRRTFGALQEHARARREEDMVNGVLASLLDTFGPWYNAYTFVLSRQDEYEADQTASRVAGSEASASGLIRTALLSDWLRERFWPRLYAKARDKETPDFMPYTAMRKLLGATLSEWATHDLLRKAWTEDSGVHDTHPCLRDRVTALGEARALPAAFKTSAAEALLGEQALVLAREFDQAWWAEEKQGWQNHHRRNRRTAEFERRPLDELSEPELQEFALLLWELRSPAAAKPVLAHLLKRPGGPWPKPLYFYGLILLDEDNRGGLDYLEQAWRASPALGEDCARAGYQWLAEKDNEAAAERWLERVEHSLGRS
jgi:Zn-dependent protease with chaperone function